MGVAAGQADHQRSDIFGELVAIMRGVGQQDFLDADDLGGSLGDRAAIVTGHQNGDIATQLGGSSDGVEGGRLENGVVVFGNDQNAHDSVLTGLDDVRFVAELVHQGGDGIDLDAGLALRRFLHL